MARKKIKVSTTRPIGWTITDPARPGWSETGTTTAAELKKAMTPPLKRHHAAKKSPAQLQREIDEALYGADFDRLSRSPGLPAAPSTFDEFDRKWERLAEQGKTDDLGGAEYRRVKNEWVSAGRPIKAIEAFIRSGVSLLPYSQSEVHAKRAHAKRLAIYEKGQRVAVLDDRGHEIGRGHVYSGDNYPEPNERTTWVKMTRHGETATEEWPTLNLAVRD